MYIMAEYKLCMPALVYLVLALIGVFMTMRSTGIMSGVGSLIFVGLWTWFLNYLCSKGHAGISWFLVFLPLIGFAIMMFVALESSMNMNKNSAMMNMKHSSMGMY